jgi:hypothetical protein
MPNKIQNWTGVPGFMAKDSIYSKISENCEVIQPFIKNLPFGMRASAASLERDCVEYCKGCYSADKKCCHVWEGDVQKCRCC